MEERRRLGLKEWLASFRQLHAKAREGALAREELAGYRAARDELARAVLASQRLSVQPGQTARRSLRIARALQVELELQDGTARAMTLEVASGGFSVLLGKPPRAGDECGFSLRLGGGAVRGRVRVADVKAGVGSARIGLQIVEMADEEREVLELAVFDAVLDALKDVGQR